ncbi:hypothetical protein EAG_07140 [Camponotus floridanus]|uniref:Uncharacterized protein n=1 Tax=Camponotus floridanus TaxID=104421 RepID=E2ADC4_CAMFO|nr:hypothetical protein EAG_07140 [Camponotus floridanus]
MYLRSRQRAAQGRHEHTREAIGASLAAACGRTDPGSSLSSGSKGGIKRRVTACRYHDLALAPQPQPQPQPRPLRSGSAGRGADSDLVCLKRGMSEGERAAITPRIGWRKLTDPGD